MADYLWAEANGEIVEGSYNESNDKLSPEQAKQELLNALSLNENKVTINTRDDINYVYDITASYRDGSSKSFVICVRELTPGGRDNLKDEQRIQPESQQINAVYNAIAAGKNAALLGVYKRNGITIFCAWKANLSNAKNKKTGISKQIKIKSIAHAISEGFVQQSKGSGEYACAFKKEFIYFYLNNSSWLHNINSEKIDESIFTPETVESENEDVLQFKTGFNSKFERNRIVFGAPGTGKSYLLKKDSESLLSATDGTYERVTFHPDYAYSHFVGTYKPVTDDEGEISYKFVPGPFMRVYVNALRSGRTSKPQPHLLLIEEINRSKVAAVFGDIFQMLDRDDDGVSEYEIQTSEDIRQYLVKELSGDLEDYSRIRIPDNMFIWATMNSADQGVFPMDTAFKRRWNFEYIGINDNDSSIFGRIQLGRGPYALDVEWNQLRKAINDKLTLDFKVNEDKLMGPFFLSNKILKTNEDQTIVEKEKFIAAFKSKVIMYLYEDAAKQHKYKLFEGCNNSKYSSVCDDFDVKGISIFGDRFLELYRNHGV